VGCNQFNQASLSALLDRGLNHPMQSHPAAGRIWDSVLLNATLKRLVGWMIGDPAFMVFEVAPEDRKFLPKLFENLYLLSQAMKVS
jgi:hypothetical protein